MIHFTYEFDLHRYLEVLAINSKDRQSFYKMVKNINGCNVGQKYYSPDTIFQIAECMDIEKIKELHKQRSKDYQEGNVPYYPYSPL